MKYSGASCIQIFLAWSLPSRPSGWEIIYPRMMVDMMMIYLSGFFVNLHTRANYLKEKIFLIKEAPLISNHEMCAISASARRN